MACITEAIGARMSHDFGVPNDLLHHILMFLNSYDLVQLSSTTKALNKRISESIVVWSHIGHYDFNEISIGMGIQGMGGVENKEDNVPSNGKDEVKVREDTFYDDCHTGNNKSSNDGTNAKDIEAKSFRMTKDQYRQKYTSRLKALRHDIHVRHINNLEMLAKDRQEYWRRPLIWCTSFHALVCPFFLVMIFIIALMVRLDDPAKSGKTWFGVFFPLWAAFACAGVGMYIAVKSSRHRRDNGNEGHQNSQRRLRRLPAERQSQKYRENPVFAAPTAQQFSAGELPIGLNEAENVEDEEGILEDRNDYSVWVTQWPTVQASLHGFIVHELLKHSNTAIHHCTCLSAMVILFPTLIYLKVEFGLAGMPWSVTFVPIWICLLGFLCAPCSRWVFEEKKAHLLFFLIICFIWIPTLIGSILLAYKLDLHDPGKMKLRYVFVPFWTIDAIIFLAFVVSQIFIVRKQLKQNAAVENAHQRRSVVRPTLCLTMFFCLLFMPLLLFTVQLCVQDEGYYANASGWQENPISFSAVFSPLMIWMAFACFAILILGVATGKENERLHEFRERIRIEDDLENGERILRDGNGVEIRGI